MKRHLFKKLYLKSAIVGPLKQSLEEKNENTNKQA
jgi:hypothetical protein